MGIQETACVTVTVTAVNDPPVGLDDTFNVDQDSDVNFLDVLNNDSSAPDTGETLKVTAIGSTTTSNGGTVSIATDGIGRELSNQPPATRVPIPSPTR